MTMRRWTLVLVFLVVAGCSGHKAVAPLPQSSTTVAPLTDQERADQACRAAARRDFFNAQPTTVGAIHAITGGPRTSGHPGHPWSNLLAGAPDHSFAAWCWRQPEPQNYVLYVVGPKGEVVPLNVASQGPYPPRPGPLAVV